MNKPTHGKPFDYEHAMKHDGGKVFSIGFANPCKILAPPDNAGDVPLTNPRGDHFVRHKQYLLNLTDPSPKPREAVKLLAGCKGGVTYETPEGESIDFKLMTNADISVRKATGSTTSPFVVCENITYRSIHPTFEAALLAAWERTKEAIK